MVWTIKYTEVALKQMKKLDKNISNRIDKYLNDRVAKQKKPNDIGKALLHDKIGLWRYRVDDYRIICKLIDNELIVLVLQVAHRQEVYHSKKH